MLKVRKIFGVYKRFNITQYQQSHLNPKIICLSVLFETIVFYFPKMVIFFGFVNLLVNLVKSRSLFTKKMSY